MLLRVSFVDKLVATVPFSIGNYAEFLLVTMLK